MRSYGLILAVCFGLLLVAPGVARADATTATPMVTITMSRTELSAADQSVGGETGSCVRDDANIATLDGVVLPWMATNTPKVHLTGSIETGVTKDTAPWCAHYGETAAASWADMLNMQNLYGMRFISHSSTYAMNWGKLTPQQQYDQTCGSRDAIIAHGLLGADGQFNWPNNKVSFAVQQAYVQPCFYFNRIYGTGLNTLAWSLVNHHEVVTKGFSGGSCNTTGLTCSTVNSTKKYTTPAQIINKIKALKPGQHLSLQSYVFVTGTNPAYVTNKTRTSSNPALHWTSDVERYCWQDAQAIFSFLQTDSNVVVTDPEGVAIAWGMTPPTMP